MQTKYDEVTMGPLQGIRVLELTQAVAGPSCGRILAEMGAEVFKIESLEGDPYRNTNTVVPNEGKRFQSLNLGKKSIAIDLKHPDGQQLVHDLAVDSDVLLTNFRFGVPERLGFGYEQIQAINPRLIYARITGFGTKSSQVGRPASDPMMQSYSGLTVNGGKLNEEGLPILANNTIADYSAGMGAAIGILEALLARTQTNTGQLVDASLLRGALVLQDTAVMREPTYDAKVRDILADEIKKLKQRGGSFGEVNDLRESINRGGIAGIGKLIAGPRQVKDGVMTLGALTPANRAAAARALEVTPDEIVILSDRAHPDHEEQMEKILERTKLLFASRTVDEWTEIFNREGCPSAPVNIPELMSEDPIVQEADHMVELVHAVTGPQRVVAPLVDLSHTPTKIQHAATPLGSYTRQVLTQLGKSDEEISRLIDAKIITEYLGPTSD